jgi:hypothetical protein
MRQIAKGPLGSELQKAEAHAIVLQGQSPAPIETNEFLSREGEGPRETLLTRVCELIARIFNYLFEMITRIFANRGCASAVEKRASDPPEFRIDPPIGKQPRHQFIDGPRREPAIIKPAPLALSARFPPEDAARATRRTSERNSDWPAGTSGSLTKQSNSPRRSTQQISAASPHTHRSDISPSIRTSGDRHLTSSENLNPRMLLTYKPTKKTPK